MRTRRITLLFIFLVASGLVIWSATATSTTQTGNRFGPNPCAVCPLGAPAPDTTTAVYLKRYTLVMDRPRGLKNATPVSEGDVVIVCNGSACVDYKMTYTGQFEGVNVRPQTTSPPRAGGGGSGSGHGSGQGVGRGGGADVGGGSYGGSGGRTGTVTVGPGGPVPKLPKGSQEI